jgi:hypothetical protein
MSVIAIFQQLRRSSSMRGVAGYCQTVPSLTLNCLRLFTIEQFFRLGRSHHAVKTLHDVAVKTEGTDSPDRCPRSMSHMWRSCWQNCEAIRARFQRGRLPAPLGAKPNYKGDWR